MKKRLGRVQLRIMDVLWAMGRASARQITEALSEGDSIAHSTVQTLLRQLEAKGVVAHEMVDRTFVFHPLIERSEAARTATRELVDGVFAGSVGGLVAYLLRNERIAPEELNEIRRLIGKMKE
jgi:BlaI family transcriptional regulator, penicillinase repressor